MEITNEMIYGMLVKFKDETDQRFISSEQRNEMIYGMLVKFKDETDQRFISSEQRNEMTYEMLKEFKVDTNNRFERLEALQMEDHKILMNLWEHKDSMKLSLTRSLLTVTGIVSGVVAIIVSFITGKAIILKS